MMEEYSSLRKKGLHELSLGGEPAVVSAAKLQAERGRVITLWNEMMEDR